MASDEDYPFRSQLACLTLILPTAEVLREQQLVTRSGVELSVRGNSG